MPVFSLRLPLALAITIGIALSAPGTPASATDLSNRATNVERQRTALRAVVDAGFRAQGSSVVAFSPDVRLMAMGTWVDEGVAIVNSATVALLRCIPFDLTAPREFSPDGLTVAVASFQRRAEDWVFLTLRVDTGRAQEVGRLSAGSGDADYNEPLFAFLRFSGDGSSFLYVRPDGWTGTATKTHIRAVLDVLTGRFDAAGALGLGNIEATPPNDLVMVHFSKYGFSSDERFYLVPQDVSADDGAADRLISSDELASWPRPADATDIVLVIDACYSAGSVEAGGFRPSRWEAAGWVSSRTTSVCGYWQRAKQMPSRWSRHPFRMASSPMHWLSRVWPAAGPTPRHPSGTRLRANGYGTPNGEFPSFIRRRGPEV